MRTILNFFVVANNLVYTIYITFLSLFEMFLGKLDQKRLDSRFRWWSHKMLASAGLSYSVHNRESITLASDQKYIIMCNHASFYDIPLAVVSANTSIRMLVKKELMQIPVWGNAMKATDFISIDRKNSRQAIKDLKKAKKVLEKGIVLWIAPEGTRSRDGRIQPFKRGGFKLAMEIGATIIPMAIKGSEKIMPAGTMQIHRGMHADVYFGEPIDASRYTNSTRSELINAVETQIREMCGQES